MHEVCRSTSPPKCLGDWVQFKTCQIWMVTRKSAMILFKTIYTPYTKSNSDN
jgi:hypothetical protein